MSIPIPDGYELLTGRSRANATAALATADERGFPPESVRTHREGYLIPLPLDAEVTEIVFPTAKDNVATIDDFAATHDVSYDGIVAENADKPTKAEKVAHIEKVIGERAEQNSADLENTGSGGGLETNGE